MEFDDEKTAEIALAVLSLTTHRDGPFTRVWKQMDWEVLDTLYQREWILNPVGKSKSIVLTDEGITKSLEYRAKYLSASGEDTERLAELENGMWLPNKRYNEKWLREHLHPEFVEIGRSGSIYNYDDMFPVHSSEINCQLPLPNLVVTYIADGVATVNYDSHLINEDEKLSTHRSSIWINVNGKWLLKQHQGTAFST